ncbi:MAG: DUF4388 domain-containing protein [Planctomycetes bacterium]|nr:DUF4388 domain-containing protein [Planctomycetota bacterium]
MNLPELPRRVLKALAHRRQLEEDLAVSGPSAVDGKGLTGTLDQVGLATLLGVLGNTRRSGILRLSGSLLQSEMMVYLVHGRVFRVELQGKGRLSAPEAKEQVFRRLEGPFEFMPMALRVVDEMNLSTTQLLLHGARRPAPAAVPF